MLAATKKINGGTNGLDDRTRKFGKYLAEMSSPGVAAATVATSQAPVSAAERGMLDVARRAKDVPVVAMPAALSPAAAVTAPAALPSVSESTVTVPTAPVVPPAPQAAIPMPINSKAPMEVRVTNDQPASQDLRDRRLAMIATGGLGG